MFEKIKVKNFIKKNLTILIIGLILLTAVLISAIFQLTVASSGQIIILVDGQEWGTYSLQEKQEIRIETEQGYNLLVIEDGRAYVKEADCDNQVCVHTQPVKENGGQIICLPHRVVIRLKKEEKSEIDAVTN